MKLIWTAKARLSLLDILLYIAQDSPDRAIHYGQKIEKKVLALKSFPTMGREIPEMTGEFLELRELLIDDYRLVYRIHADRVEILVLFHGRRRFPATL